MNDGAGKEQGGSCSSDPLCQSWTAAGDADQAAAQGTARGSTLRVILVGANHIFGDGDFVPRQALLVERALGVLVALPVGWAFNRALREI